MVVNKDKLKTLISRLDPEMVAQATEKQRVNMTKLFELVTNDYLKLVAQSSETSADQENSKYDPLTKLPNRSFFAQTVEQAIKRAERRNKFFALIFIDIDHFKNFNDTHGHLVGDELLKELSQRILTTIRKSDTLCRLSGDEFCLLVEELDQANVILQILESIKKQIATPFEIDDHSLTVTTSMGVSMYPDDGKNYIDLLHFADLAMYEAKRSGRNTVNIFTPEISDQVRRLNHHQKQLKTALKTGDFNFGYQPELELSTGNISCVRQVVSLPNPGLESEEAVYYTAHRSKHLCRLNIELIDQACRAAQRWQHKFQSIPRIVVPLYTDLLCSPQVTRIIADAMSKHQIEGDVLEFEINEADFNQQSSNGYAALKKVFELGCQISLINMGIGPSSLQLISSGFIHKIKIDSLLVSKLDLDPQSYAMMATMIELCDKFSIHTVALDVMSLNQIKLLEHLNCGSIRGDFLSPALSNTDYEKVLTNYVAQQSQNMNCWEQQHETIRSSLPT